MFVKSKTDSKQSLFTKPLFALFIIVHYVAKDILCDINNSYPQLVFFLPITPQIDIPFKFVSSVFPLKISSEIFLKLSSIFYLQNSLKNKIQNRVPYSPPN